MKCVVQPSFPPPPPPPSWNLSQFPQHEVTTSITAPFSNVVKTKMHIRFCSQVCHRYSYHILQPSLIYYFTVHTHGSMQSICVILLSYKKKKKQMLMSSMHLSIILLNDEIISCAFCSGGISLDHLPSSDPLHPNISQHWVVMFVCLQWMIYCQN